MLQCSNVAILLPEYINMGAGVYTLNKTHTAVCHVLQAQQMRRRQGIKVGIMCVGRLLPQLDF